MYLLLLILIIFAHLTLEIVEPTYSFIKRLFFNNLFKRKNPLLYKESMLSTLCHAICLKSSQILTISFHSTMFSHSFNSMQQSPRQYPIGGRLFPQYSPQRQLRIPKRQRGMFNRYDFNVILKGQIINDSVFFDNEFS